MLADLKIFLLLNTAYSHIFQLLFPANLNLNLNLNLNYLQIFFIGEIICMIF